MGKLTQKQKRFCEEYMIDLNATQAAIRAGYSEKTAHVQGCTLLKNPKVKDFVTERRADVSEKTSRTAQDAIKDIVRLATLAEKSGDLKTAIRGFELEAKHHGGFIERKADVMTDGTDAPRNITIEFVGVDDD